VIGGTPVTPSRPVRVDEIQDSTETEQEARKRQDFSTMILDNLKKAVVQNIRANGSPSTGLDPYAGAWLQPAGDTPTPTARPRRVAVSIGPEHGTVGPQQVREAARKLCRAWASKSSLSAVSPSTRM
jgi:adenine-specific DNA-methyltransferase